MVASVAMKTPSAPTPPAAAFRFDAVASFDAAPNGSDTVAGKFSGVAYSGDPITRHWFWGTVAFDLASTTAPERIPVLVEHDRGQRAGFAALTINDQRIEIADGTLMATPIGESIYAESKAGFPWQLSVDIHPGSVEEVPPGQKVTVNGRELTGPAYVFRNSLIREVSFTPTGADPGTEATAMSGRHALPSPTTQDDTMPTIDELTATVTQMSAQLTALQEQGSAEKARADAAEKALAEHRKALRTAAVKELFSAVGREATPETMAPYMDMADTVFAAVAADLKASRPQPPEGLFIEQARDDEQFSSGSMTTQQREAASTMLAGFIAPARV